MKHFFFSFLMLFAFQSIGQNTVTFEELTVPTSGYWNGSNYSGFFKSGDLEFKNSYSYDSTFGEYWSGFAYSNIKNDTTGNYSNQYASFAGSGYNQSMNYAVGYSNTKIIFTGNVSGKSAEGFYMTNGTYPALSMKNGDAFTKKFGGVSGNDPDIFGVIMTIWNNGNTRNDSILLADFRFDDNSKDYIQKEWKWVDLTDKGNIDSIEFNFFSSDTGIYGINTPSYFCLDNFTTKNSYAGISSKMNPIELNVYPNPTSGEVFFLMPNQGFKGITEIWSMQGMIISTTSVRENNQVDLSNLPTGMYLLKIKNNDDSFIARIIKQ